VIVVSTELNTGSKKMMEKLRSLGIESYLISFSSIYTIMPKITKIVVSCYALMSDGGIISDSGIYSIGLVILIRLHFY
jgi:translation initiation factor eIF-2B subunit beta